MYKKSIILLVLITFLGAGSALAALQTWTDEIDFNPDLRIGWFDSETYTHDIKDDGFTPGTDFAYNYSLSVALYDDNARWDEQVLFHGVGEAASIDQPGWIADGFYNFNYINQDFGWSFAGLISLNMFGELDVTVTSWWGDFYLDYSVLSVHGYDAAPVPEPGTLILLGAGLAGLALYRRRKS